MSMYVILSVKSTYFIRHYAIYLIKSTSSLRQHVLKLRLIYKDEKVKTT